MAKKVILITGGSSGIGKATAAQLMNANSEFAVAICGRDLTRLEAAISELRPDGERFHAVQADVTRNEDIERLVSATLRRFGQIDVLINSAGAGYLGTFSETNEETMDRLWNVNVKGAMRMTQAVLPTMISQKSGQILNLCGVLGVKTIANACSLLCDQARTGRIRRCARTGVEAKQYSGEQYLLFRCRYPVLGGNTRQAAYRNAPSCRRCGERTGYPDRTTCPCHHKSGTCSAYRPSTLGNRRCGHNSSDVMATEANPIA